MALKSEKELKQDLDRIAPFDPFGQIQRVVRDLIDSVSFSLLDFEVVYGVHLKDAAGDPDVNAGSVTRKPSLEIPKFGSDKKGKIWFAIPDAEEKPNCIAFHASNNNLAGQFQKQAATQDRDGVA